MSQDHQTITKRSAKLASPHKSMCSESACQNRASGPRRSGRRKARGTSRRALRARHRRAWKVAAKHGSYTWAAASVCLTHRGQVDDLHPVWPMQRSGSTEFGFRRRGEQLTLRVPLRILMIPCTRGRRPSGVTSSAPCDRSADATRTSPDEFPSRREWPRSGPHYRLEENPGPLLTGFFASSPPGEKQQK